MTKEIEDRVIDLVSEKQRTTSELQKMKADHAATLKRLEKEMAELKKNEVLARWRQEGQQNTQ